MLIQERWRVSKSFEVYATPFAFLIDAGGVVRSAGICGSRQHLNYVLTGAGRRAEEQEHNPEPLRAAAGADLPIGPNVKKETTDV